LASPKGQSPSTDDARPDKGVDGRAPGRPARKLPFPRKDTQRRAKEKADAKAAAERDARLEEKRIILEINRAKLKIARLESAASDHARDLDLRKQTDEAIARERIDHLRADAYRGFNNARNWLLPCVYCAVAGIVYGVATGRVHAGELKVLCSGVGLLIFALLKDPFGLSLRVQLWRRFLDSKRSQGRGRWPLSGRTRSTRSFSPPGSRS
jgi:hypothetical protein